ncbi:MAG: hypothetical protein NZM25_09125 [Leptospiraceae bacterium]|nr:hypothetical protein [Leptospiraceae bacterium]MDW8307301.1 hypothetical protein [Leptospiraceae bacterium]
MAKWSLQLRLAIILGVAGLILGLLFAFLAHYLTQNLRRNLLEKQAAQLVEKWEKYLHSSREEELQRLLREGQGKIQVITPEGKALFPRLSSAFPLKNEEIEKLSIEKYLQKEGRSLLEYGPHAFLIVSNKKIPAIILLYLGSDSARKIILVYYILALLVGALMALVGFVLSSEINHALWSLKKLFSGEFPEEKVKLPYTELEDLYLTIKKQFTLPAKNDNVGKSESVMRSDNEEIIGYLQKVLYEKPFPKLKNFELALFPRNPGIEAENFINAREKADSLEILVARFDLNDLEANLWKHRLQEKFISLFEADIPTEKRIHSIWQTMFHHVDLGPGLLYLKLSPQKNQIYRCGSFFVYMHQENGWQLAQAGDSFFTSNFSVDDVQNLPIANDMLILTQDVLELLQQDAEELTQYLNQNCHPPAREIVLPFARLVHEKQKQDPGFGFSGLILAAHKKS